MAKHGSTSVVVRTTGKGKFQQHITAGKHELTADEPVKLGGDDSGFAPYDLLRAALGACKSMTLRMYADHKDWPLEGVDICVTHEKLPTEDGKQDVFHCQICLHGEGLSDEQRARLIEIADKCPVHRTLQAHDTVIETLEFKGKITAQKA